MRDLNYELKQLCRRNRDGGCATQRDRERVLDQMANQLQEMGFRHLGAKSLKPKHVEALVERWKLEGLAIGTLKNRMTELRWWAEKIDKQNVVARSNESYGIANREYVTNVSKARELTAGDLSKITDPHTRLSLKLQAAFGLRRAESSLKYTRACEYHIGPIGVTVTTGRPSCRRMRAGCRGERPAELACFNRRTLCVGSP